MKHALTLVYYNCIFQHADGSESIEYSLSTHVHFEMDVVADGGFEPPVSGL